MKTTTKQTVSDKSTGYHATKSSIVMFAVYSSLFVAWLVAQFHK